MASPESRRIITIGAAVGSLPLVTSVMIIGARSSLDGMIGTAIRDIRPGRGLPLPRLGGPPSAYLDHADALFNPFEWPIPAGSQIALAFYGTLGIVVGATAAAIASSVRDREPRDWRSLSLAATSLCLLPQVLQRADFAHVRLVACIAVPLAVASIRVERRRTPMLVAIIGFFCVAAPFFVVRPWNSIRELAGTGDTPSVETSHGAFPVQSEAMAAELESLQIEVQDIATSRSRLVVAPADLTRTPYNETYLYFVLGLRPATYFIEMNPGTANSGERLADDIAEADLLVLSDRYGRWTEPNTSGNPGTRLPLVVVAACFEDVTEVAVYEVLTRADC